MSPADSVLTAARYLCASGAGSASGVSGALLRYNHAQWYVDLVLRVEHQLLVEQTPRAPALSHLLRRS
jgi:membrane-bound lytic murein transglycosylase B